MIKRLLGSLDKKTWVVLAEQTADYFTDHGFDKNLFKFIKIEYYDDNEKLLAIKLFKPPVSKAGRK